MGGIGIIFKILKNLGVMEMGVFTVWDVVIYLYREILSRIIINLDNYKRTRDFCYSICDYNKS